MCTYIYICTHIQPYIHPYFAALYHFICLHAWLSCTCFVFLVSLPCLLNSMALSWCISTLHLHCLMLAPCPVFAVTCSVEFEHWTALVSASTLVCIHEYIFIYICAHVFDHLVVLHAMITLFSLPCCHVALVICLPALVTFLTILPSCFDTCTCLSLSWLPEFVHTPCLVSAACFHALVTCLAVFICFTVLNPEMLCSHAYTYYIYMYTYIYVHIQIYICICIYVCRPIKCCMSWNCLNSCLISFHFALSQVNPAAPWLD